MLCICQREWRLCVRACAHASLSCACELLFAFRPQPASLGRTLIVAAMRRGGDGARAAACGGDARSPDGARAATLGARDAAARQSARER
eukprot:3348355-Pleurochrysis_carterae.AAC.2